MDIQFVDELTLPEINEKYLSPYLPLARKLLRGWFPSTYTISELVTDDYLDELLCVRFRDLLRIKTLLNERGSASSQKSFGKAMLKTCVEDMIGNGNQPVVKMFDEDGIAAYLTVDD